MDPNSELRDEAAREPLRLDHFMKFTVGADTGGQAKLLIQDGQVRVNGEVETRRRRKLYPGDVVEFAGKRYPVTESQDA